MTIDRRTFVAGTASAALAPTIALLPVNIPTPATASGRLVLKIEGWSRQDENGTADVAWIRIGHSWRTAWR
jgi:hypothetical protein